MLHYLAILAVVYLIVFIAAPQHVLALTFIAFAWLSSWDIWYTVPWSP